MSEIKGLIKEIGVTEKVPVPVVAECWDSLGDIEGRHLTEQQCFRQGLLVLGCGENAVRLAPPMIVTEAEADTALAIMDTVLADLE